MPRLARACLDARHRVAQIVVLHQRGADQILQLFVFEDLAPFEIGQRCGLRRRQRLRRAKVCGTGTAGR